MKPQKPLIAKEILRKKNKARSSVLPNFKLQYKISHKKERNLAICDNMDEVGEFYAIK